MARGHRRSRWAVTGPETEQVIVPEIERVTVRVTAPQESVATAEVLAVAATAVELVTAIAEV